ncbi:nesprin-1-like [Sinocyclocheilus grahami]|uniref:nesprin-1-like n=1 Tax=Sinocyclocheilus grahami TaxID=75366 RepID=UPI0007ACA5A4|nr:PREDICTED: nesprin-1-like [Sinocyclocheilus grahami]
MESKVSQNGDISIEEMIEKLRKDYQEEVAVVQENKHELQQLGERLARASHESKASEIEHKLGKVNERWQHLLDLIGASTSTSHCLSTPIISYGTEPHVT